MAGIDAARISLPIRRCWIRTGVLGAILVALGLWAVVHPLVSSVVTLVWLGALLAAAGVVEILHAWSAEGWRGTLWHLISGAVGLLGGLFVVFQPVPGLIALVWLIAGMLVASGSARLVAGFALRPADGWLWLSAGGLVGIAAGGMVLILPPEQSLLVPGLLVGVTLVFEGMVLLALAMAARRALRLKS